jgi:S-adenosylmethionine synthetase
MVTLDQQSADISAGVDNSIEVREGESSEKSVGAGDQGLMLGFASNETEEYMPIAITLAHEIMKKLADVRKNHSEVTYLRPDSKSQVTVEYRDGVAARIDTIVVSTQHDPVVRGEEDNKKVQEIIAKDIQKYVLDEIISKSPIKTDANTTYFFNPSGRFVVGGPQGDAGLTGRKIIVDTYGGYARHGGGAFSGKDPTKVDRSAAYAARHAAKNIVAAGIADQCEIQISYAIGVANPTSIYVNTFGTSEYSDEVIIGLVQKVFDFRPQKIIENFNLQNLSKERGGRFYQDVAKYGHFGRKDLDLPWEKLDKVEELKKVLAQDFNLSLSK